MVFDVATLVSRISHLVTLEIGDVILTGTPSDLGAGPAPLYLQDGDVISVEINPALKEIAAKNLAPQAFDNISLEAGDAAKGWARPAPYDIIVLTGSTPVLPQSLLDQIKPGGRLFAIVGDAPVMQALLVTRTAPGAFQTTVLFETCLAPLTHAAQPARFTF